MNILKFKIIFFSITLLISLSSFSQIRDFESTRLQSTSGAGVASILVNESSILNPAPIVFIPVSAFYYQAGSSKLDTKSPKRSKNFSNGSNQMYLLSDSSGQIKGTFSYQEQAENQYKRKRYTSSLANNSGKKTAFGLLYRYTIDEDSLLDEEKKFHQGVFGFTHIYSPELSFGGIIVDPFLSNKKDARIVLGFQYELTSNFYLIADGGANFNDESHKNTVSRGALQVNFFRDLFLRTGKYHDKANNLKGSSWGISWIGPRLSFEYAYKTSEVIQDNTDYLFQDEQIIESSFSMAIVF
jgi:hypothetical protein